ncbi:4813_t:CDS:2, partial [Racocetra fulgida]
PFSALNSPILNIQPEEEVSLLQQPLNALSTVVTTLPSDPTTPSLEQPLNTIYNSSESQGLSVRTSPIRPPSALRHQQNQDESEDFSHSAINSVLEPISPAVVLEPSSYRQIRHGAGSNLLSRDFATSFSRHSDSDSSGTLSTQLQMIPQKKLSQTKPPINDSPYASIAKSMPRIVYNPAPISHADSRGHKRLYQIIPRNLDPSPPTEDLEDPENNTQNNPNNPFYPMRSVPLPKEVNINGQTVRLKYCETCYVVEEEVLNVEQVESVLNGQRESQQTKINITEPNAEQSSEQNPEQNPDKNTELNIKQNPELNTEQDPELNTDKKPELNTELNTDNTEPKLTETHEQV